MPPSLSKLNAFRIRAHVESGAQRRYRHRPRSYDEAILRYVAYYRTVTICQLLYRFFVYAGKGDRYGYTVVRRLVQEGFLVKEPLDPERGARSQHILMLSATGWQVLGLRPRIDRHAAADVIRDYRLQFADLMLEREVNGWRLVPRSKTHQALKKWALAHYQHRLLNPTEVVIRERLERMSALELRLRVIRHTVSGEVRILLPVRRGRSYKASIAALPSLSLIPVVPFELVCSDVTLAQPAQRSLQRWAAQTKTMIRIHQHPHFRTRRVPDSRMRSRPNLYARYNLDPLTLI